MKHLQLDLTHSALGPCYLVGGKKHRQCGVTDEKRLKGKSDVRREHEKKNPNASRMNVTVQFSSTSVQKVEMTFYCLGDEQEQMGTRITVRLKRMF